MCVLEENEYLRFVTDKHCCMIALVYCCMLALVCNNKYLLHIGCVLDWHVERLLHVLYISYVRISID